MFVARGTRPFRIETRQDELAYPAGTVEFLADRDEDLDDDAAAAAHGAYAELVLQALEQLLGGQRSIGDLRSQLGGIAQPPGQLPRVRTMAAYSRCWTSARSWKSLGSAPCPGRIRQSAAF